MSRKLVFLSAAALAVAGSGWVHAYRAQSAAPTMYLQSFERQACRILYWDGQAGPKGEFTVAYSAPAWTEKLAAQVDGVTAGQRVRLGKDQWTSLDTNIDLTIGGVGVPAGYYYLAMEKTEAGWDLIAMEAGRIMKQCTDPFMTAQTTGGIVIPMAYAEEEEEEDELSIEFISADKQAVELEILFGPHKLTADVVASIKS